VLIVSHDRDFLDRTVTGVLAFEADGKIVPHAGGYSDYLERRRQNSARKAGKTAKKQSGKTRQNSPAETISKAARNRLSYKQVYQLEQLPKEIDALRARIAEAEIKLADMDFFARDGEGYERLAKQTAQDKTDIAEKEESWLELEILREQIQAD
jgi:ATP-binding cassette subfamily F protein uup